MIKIFITLLTLFISSSLHSQTIEKELGHIEIEKIESDKNGVKKVELTVHVKDNASLIFKFKDGVLSTSVIEKKNRITFVKLDKNSVIIYNGDSTAKIDNVTLIKPLIKNGQLSILKSNGEPVYFKLSEYDSENKEKLQKVRVLGKAFLKAKNLNWGKIQKVTYQNDFKRYIVEYNWVYTKKLGREITRMLFVEEINGSVTIVPN